MSNKLYKKRSKNIRELIVRGLKGGKRGHVGSSMSLVEILIALYDHVLKFKSNDQNFPKRDRLILSKGHGCLALYAILADKKFFPKKYLDSFCKSDSLLGGHPDITVPGVETISGSLGIGFSVAVGIASSLKIKKNLNKVFVIIGDGELNEGIVWESCMTAFKNKLDNLVLIIDNNNLQTYDSPNKVAGMNKIEEKLKSFGFITRSVNGHSIPKLIKTFKQIPYKKDKPTAIICNTIKGKGITFAENNKYWHHKSSISSEDLKKIEKELN